MLEGDTVAHYRILGRIGAGSMGVVCKARDLRLDRVVALKYLSPEAIGDRMARQRLLQEARAASQLDHPNVCRIHQIEELPDGQVLLVLAFYEGDTLEEHIGRGPLPCDVALRYGSQLLSGLHHAHEHGVVHRDIKPANIIVLPTGEIRIVDFGLARSGTDTTQLTETGALLGTVCYMSPEQVLCQGVDHRCDSWAAGVVIYQMLTGRLPFWGENPYAVFDAILQAKPLPAHHHRPDLSPSISATLARALARDLADRFLTAGEFRSALCPPATDAPVAPETVLANRIESRSGRFQSLAVLPFTLLDGQPDAEYFCDGLTEEIITDLSAIRSLRIICSASAMRLKGSGDDLATIARQLRVRYVLKGTVRLGKKPAGTIRVTAQLIDPPDDCTLWASKYTGTMDDVFAIQESISREIVGALRLTLSDDEDRQLQARPLPNVHAYEFYLKSKHEILSYSREALDRALGYLEQGERLVGNNAVLLCAKGQVFWQYINAGISTDPLYMVKAKDCAARALALEPESAHAARLLGLIAMAQGDMQRAAQLLKQAITLDPNDSDSLSWYCALCALGGKAEVAAPLGQHILAIDPLTPVYRFIPGLLSLMSGEFEAALAPFDDALSLDPGNSMLLWCRGQVLAMSNRRREAVEQFHALHTVCPEGFFTCLGAFMAAALAHDSVGARALATDQLREPASADPHYSWAMAQGYVVLGHGSEALWWLENAMERGFLNYPMLHLWDPLLEPVRRDSRFLHLLGTVRERWENFQV